MWMDGYKRSSDFFEEFCVFSWSMGIKITIWSDNLSFMTKTLKFNLYFVNIG